MKGITNSISFDKTVGGNKITDYLEDPIDITTLTYKELDDLAYTRGYLLFVDGFNMKSYNRTIFFHTGYIPYSNDPEKIPFNTKIIYCDSKNNYSSKWGVQLYFIFYSTEASGWGISSTDIASSSANDKVTLSIAKKIWIGKYKQQILD